MAEITKIQRVDIKKLVPYEKNAKKHGEKQIDKLVESIKEFGFISPLLIDKDFNVVAGHGRMMAAEKCGLEKLPCVFIEGLTENQRRAFIIAENRLSEFGQWDMDLVHSELGDLDGFDFSFDLDNFEFPDVNLAEADDDGYYGDERKRTDNAYNLEMTRKMSFTDDFWQMPIIENNEHVPNRLIGFNYAKTSKDYSAGIHFFVDDYQFERVWNYPEKYVDVLGKFDCILSPDFSLYLDMPMPMKIWNVYRSRFIGRYYQKAGVKVIPTISWGEKETFKFCFLGIPKGSIVAVSTVGVKEKEAALAIWNDGMQEMIRQIEPQKILVYGGALDFDYKNIPVVYFDNEILKNWKER